MPIIKNSHPMNYKPETPLSVSQVSINEVKQFFVNYIVSDNLGKIANAHLARSDLSEQNAFDKGCLKLAELHSRAVDFPKTGIPAEFDSKLRVREYPDFMEKDHVHTYRSNKVIGRLYRSVTEKNFKPFENINCDDRLKMSGFSNYVKEAIELKTSYDLTLLSIMNQYGITNEIEVVTGLITNYNEQIKKKYFDIKKLVMDAIKNVKAEYRRKFEKEFYIADSNIISPEKRILALKKASAWYYVTYHPDMRHERSNNSAPVMYTFPWIVYDYLVEIIHLNQKAEEIEADDLYTKERNPNRYSIEKDVSESNPIINVLEKGNIKTIDISELKNFI